MGARPLLPFCPFAPTPFARVCWGPGAPLSAHRRRTLPPGARVEVDREANRGIALASGRAGSALRRLPIDALRTARERSLNTGER